MPKLLAPLAAAEDRARSSVARRLLAAALDRINARKTAPMRADAAPMPAARFDPPAPFNAEIDRDAVFRALLVELAAGFADERAISIAEACRIAAGLLTARARLLDRIAIQAAPAEQ